MKSLYPCCCLDMTWQLNNNNKHFHNTEDLAYNTQMRATSPKIHEYISPATFAAQSLWSQMPLTASSSFWTVVLSLLCTWRSFTNHDVLTPQINSTRITWNGVSRPFSDCTHAAFPLPPDLLAPDLHTLPSEDVEWKEGLQCDVEQVA